MLQHAYLLAKICFDTAENEPANNFAEFANFANPNPEVGSDAAEGAAE